MMLGGLCELYITLGSEVLSIITEVLVAVSTKKKGSGHDGPQQKKHQACIHATYVHLCLN